jgi:hypothetical protein
MRKMKVFLTAVISSIVFTLIFISSAESADVILEGFGQSQTIQYYSQWCWDAGSMAELWYYQIYTNQFEIANWAWGRNDCDWNGNFYWSNTCNQPNQMHDGWVWVNGWPVWYGTSVQDVLAHWGVGTTYTANALSQSTAVSEINAGRPFPMGWAWTGGGGHMLVAFGYEQDGQYLWYMDPWPGHGETKSLYTWVVSEPSHTWIQTLKSTNTPYYTVTPGAVENVNGNGTISPSQPQTVAAGSSVTFHLTINKDYTTAYADGCNGTYNSSDQTYTTGPIYQNCGVAAYFSTSAVYGEWNWGYGGGDSCDGNMMDEFECPTNPSTAFSCTDSAEDEAGAPMWRMVSCY